MKIGVYDKVRPEPTSGIVDEAARFARCGRYDLIVGLGGQFAGCGKGCLP
jgi:alcohol dehydrogenase class IV